MIAAALPVVEVQTFQQKVAHNAEVAIKSGSTWVVLVAGTLLTLYTSLDDAQKATLLSQFPILSGWTPVITAVAVFLVAKLKPSSAVSSDTKALIDEVARLRMNDFLRKQGAPELPTPPPTPLPVAPATMATIAPPAAPPVEPMQERFIAGPAPPPPQAPPLPIDGRLLLSLLQEYIKQQSPPAGSPLGRGVDFDPSRR